MTVPFSIPAIRTGEPLLSPATFGNVVFSGYCCQKNPPAADREDQGGGQERGGDGDDAEFQFGKGE